MADWGAQTWLANGQSQVDTTVRMGRILGYTTVNSNGSMNVPDLAQGTGFVNVFGATPYLSTASNPPGMPTVKISGTTVTWTYTGQGGNATCKIMWGTY